MGFLVKSKVETIDGKSYDEFYVRIEGLIIQKFFGNFGVTVNHWDSEQSAKKFLGRYIEEETHSPVGQLSVGMKLPHETEFKDWPLYYTYWITGSEPVTVDFNETITEFETVEYVDFDENGNEVIMTKDVPYEKLHTVSVDLIYSTREIENYSGSLWELGYQKVKETYGNIFGIENIIDIK